METPTIGDGDLFDSEAKKCLHFSLKKSARLKFKQRQVDHMTWSLMVTSGPFVVSNSRTRNFRCQLHQKNAVFVQMEQVGIYCEESALSKYGFYMIL